MLGYIFFEENKSQVKAIPLNNVAPTTATISSLEYPGARQMFIYVKGEHIQAVPGLREFLAEYARAWSAGGYLAQHGLIPSPAEVQTKASAAATQLTAVNAAELK